MNQPINDGGPAFPHTTQWDGITLEGGQAVRTSTETLIAAMHILATEIQSDDGVANAAIAEAGERLAEQHMRIAQLEQENDALRADLLWNEKEVKP
jgi:hypothetical protein